MATCSICKSERKTNGNRIPRGWKNHGNTYCSKCWQERYALRAISIPVVKPLGSTWQELREALTEAWSVTTSMTNWMTTQLYVRDQQRRPEHEKLAAMNKPYLYPEAREQFPDLPAQTVSAIEQATASKYSRRRYQVVWTCEQSLANARYPQPAVCHNQSWKPVYESAGKDGKGDKLPCVSVPLLQGKRFLLQLRGGREFRRQLAGFRQLVSGEAIKGELSILRVRVNSSDHRNGMSERDSGGQRFSTRVVVKMVAWFPRTQTKQLSGVMRVNSDSDAFLVALDPKDEKIRIWNGDHVRRWIAAHQRQLQRWADDTKAEARPRPKLGSQRDLAVHKFRHRIQSFIQETSAQIAGVAVRRRYEIVKLDDSCRSYFGEGRFDWSGFRTYLEQRLGQEGITLQFAGETKE